MAEKAATGITEQLVSLGFESDRLKTGTPPRIDGRSLDYSKMEEQPGDEEIVGFSYSKTIKPTTQRSCWISYTNQTVHDILKSDLIEVPCLPEESTALAQDIVQVLKTRSIVLQNVNVINFS